VLGIERGEEAPAEDSAAPGAEGAEPSEPAPVGAQEG
jgi:hypothetical protein